MVDDENRADIASNERPSKSVVYIEPMREYREIIEALTTGELQGCDIFIPSVGHQRTFLAQAKAAGHDLSDRMWSFFTISLNFDDELYDVSMQIAQTVASIVQSCTHTAIGSRNAWIDEATRWAFAVTMHDRFVSVIRPYKEFECRVREYEPQTVVFVPRPGRSWRSGFDVIAQICSGMTVQYWLGHWPRKQRQINENAEILRDDLVPKNMPRYPVIRLKKTSRSQILVCGNLRDKQYKLTILPVLEGIVSQVPVTVFNYAPLDDDKFLNDFGLEKFVRRKRLNIHHKPLKGDRVELAASDRAVLLNLMRRTSIAIKGRGDGYACYEAVIVAYLGAYAWSVLDYVRRMRAMLNRVMPSVCGVVVLPGRALEANVMVGCAQRLGVPTFEIQSGTISPRRRFITPLADKVLAIDPFSKSVYCDFLGKKPCDVEVIGGPKLEYDLSRVRGLKKTDARKLVPEFSDFAEDNIAVLLASQPIGVGESGQIVSTIIDALERLPNFHLFIKMHPNESGAYERAYDSLATKRGFGRLRILKDAQVLDAVVASDIVCTYYSTVGLEAFALGRTVFTINPFADRPPFDLSQLGISQEAPNATVLRGYFEAFQSGGAASVTIDPLLEHIRDGKVESRVRQRVLASVQQYKRSRNVLSPKFYFRKASSLVRRAAGAWS